MAGSIHIRALVERLGNRWTAVWAALLTLGICGYQLSRPDALLGIHGLSNTGYDDSVYLGAAVRLVHGALPYRAFDFVHPPGIALLMAPVALLGDLTGTRDALAVARVITVLVAAANSALAALTLRRHGTSAMWVAGTALAVFPVAVTADHSLTLEPYLVMFCLLGALLLFGRGIPAERRRLMIAGAAFGVAGAVKVWALFPAVAALLCCLPRQGIGPARRVAAGIAIGFAIPCLPFFLAAPSSFVRDVVVAQLDRKTSEFGGFSAGTRLLFTSGLDRFHVLGVTSAEVVAATIASSALLLVVLAMRARHVLRLDLFVVVATGFVLVALLGAPEYFDYYAYFPGAFLALLLGVFVAHAGPLVGAWLVRPRAIVAPVAAACALVVTSFVVDQDVASANRYLAHSLDTSGLVASEIPAGACVVFDYPSIALDADRYVSARPDCPAVVDPFGMWLTRDYGSSPPGHPPLPAAFVGLWQSWLQRADYVVMFFPYDQWLPWTPAMSSYFDRNYRLLSSAKHVYVYDHFDRSATGVAATLLQKGIAAAGAGRRADAARYFRAVLAVDPADVDATFDLGVLAQGEGAADLAVTYYERAISFDPEDVNAMFNLALLDAKPDPGAALDLYARILRIRPDSPRVELEYGLLLVQTGQVAAGRPEIAQALRSDPALKTALPPGASG